MRRRKRQVAKLRVKILEDRKNGLTYEEIQRKRGVSSRTVANLVKGKDPKRFCQECGETDPKKLEEHHPDSVNFPKKTVILCANCHSKVTREQQREKAGEKQNKLVDPKVLPPHNLPAMQNPPTPPHVSYPQLKPLTPQEWRWLDKYTLYGVGGVACGKGTFDKRLPKWARWLLGIGGLACLYAGGRIK